MQIGIYTDVFVNGKHSFSNDFKDNMLCQADGSMVKKYIVVKLSVKEPPGPEARQANQNVPEDSPSDGHYEVLGGKRL